MPTFELPQFRMFTYRYPGSIHSTLLKNWQVMFHEYNYDSQGYIRGLFIIHHYTEISRIESQFFMNNPAFEIWGVQVDGKINPQKYHEYFNDFLHSEILDQFDMPPEVALEPIDSIDSCDWFLDDNLLLSF